MVILIPYTSNDVQLSTEESIISVDTALPRKYSTYIHIVIPNNNAFDFEQTSKTISELLLDNSKKIVFVVPTDKIEKLKQCFQGRHFEKSKDIIINPNILKQIKECVQNKLSTNEVRLETSTEIETNEISPNIETNEISSNIEERIETLENQYSELQKFLRFTANKVVSFIVLLFFNIFSAIIIILDDISTFIPQIIAILILVLSIIGQLWIVISVLYKFSKLKKL